MSRSIPKRLSLEALEDRCLPAVIYDPITSVLSITGSNVRDNYAIYQNVGPQGSEIVVEEGVSPYLNIHRYPTATKPIARLNASLLGGDDVLGCADNIFFPTSIDAGTGNDIITGGMSTDTIYGRTGNDTIFARDGSDVLYGHSGIDTIHGSMGDDFIYGDIGNDFLYGEEGKDTIHGGNDSDDYLYGGPETDFLYGNSGNDHVYGEDGDDIMQGNDGDDYLDGGTGVDNIQGNRNRDTLIGGDDRDYLFGGEHNDVMYGDGFARPMPGNDELDGGTGNDELYGDDGNDILRGADGLDRLNGGNHDDLLYGSTGNDTLHGDAGNDRLFGEAGTDSLFGDTENDYLNGGSSMDMLDGGEHDDTLLSLDAATTDLLYGRGGFDSFWLDRTGPMQDAVIDLSANEQDTNWHRISSFANGADRTPNGDNLVDPNATVNGSAHAYVNFSNRPLFSTTGPHFTDVRQQAVGDCWLLASIASAVNFSDNVARQMIADLGDNTYAVQIGSTFYRVDSQLPVESGSTTELAFANFGAEGSVWVPMVEKAWALFKGGSYQDLHGGNAHDPLNLFGGTNDHRYHISDGSLALGNIDANGWSGVLSTRSVYDRVTTLLPQHAYAILSVEMVAGNPVSILLYNPHGFDNLPSFDANGDIILRDDGFPLMDGCQGEDDGLITVTLQQFTDDASDPIGVYTVDFHRFL